MSGGDVTTQLLQQKARKDQERGRHTKYKPSLNIAECTLPMREVRDGDTKAGARPPSAERRASQASSSTAREPHGPGAFLSPARAQDGGSPSGAGPEAPEPWARGEVPSHDQDSSRSTHYGAGHQPYRITDSGSLHVIGKEDDCVLFSVKDNVNVHGDAGAHRDSRDTPREKKYLHVADHKSNPNKRIEYKNLDIPDDMNGVLGQGSQGVVKRVYHRPTETYFAMKILNTEGANSKQLVNELKLFVASLREKHCKHLVTFYEAYFRSTKLCILMELMEYGSLADVLKKVRFDEGEARVLAYHVLQGLNVLQEWGVVHRDIKPGNLLINRKGVAKIADFGVATFTNSLNLANSAHGTRIYMAPERINNKAYSYQADIWSFGLCVAQAVCGELLQWVNSSEKRVGEQRGPQSFSKTRFFDCAVAIAEQCFQLVFPPTLRLSEVLQNFVHRCLAQDWEARPLARELLQHPFLLPLGREAQEGCTLESSLLRRIDTLKASQVAGLKFTLSSSSMASMPHTPTSTREPTPPQARGEVPVRAPSPFNPELGSPSAAGRLDRLMASCSFSSGGSTAEGGEAPEPRAPSPRPSNPPAPSAPP